MGTGIWWSIRDPWNTCVAIDEFGPGTLTGDPAAGPSFDACGPAAIENVAANLEGRDPTYSNIGHIRQDMIANGHWTGGESVPPGHTNGCYIDDVALEIKRRNYNLVAFQSWSGAGVSADTIRGLLHDHPGAGHIFIITNAQALQGNEHGVSGHLVSIAAYDEDHDAVYVLNSDIAGQHGTATGQWMGVAQFVAAQPGGYAVMAKPAPVPPPPPPSEPAEDENTQAVTLDLQQLQQTVQQLVADALAKLQEPPTAGS